MPAALRALVIDGAEGNPFYMEELVKMLIDDGVIVVEAEGWRVLPDKLLHAHVPPTLTGVLQARLDALGARRAARAAAGRRGRPCVLGPGAGRHRPGRAATACRCCGKQLVVRRDEAAFDDTREYAFKHHLLHQVTYDGVLKAPQARQAMPGSARSGARAPRSASPQRWTRPTAARWPRRSTTAARPTRRPMCGWFEPQFTNYLNAYAAQTLRPLASSWSRSASGSSAPTIPRPRGR